MTIEIDNFCRFRSFGSISGEFIAVGEGLKIQIFSSGDACSMGDFDAIMEEQQHIQRLCIILLSQNAATKILYSTFNHNTIILLFL